MKILYFGGQKSGKSKLAEDHIVNISTQKPYYIATYDNSFDDDQMKQKIKNHHLQRGDKFITIEETTNLQDIIKPNNSYLIDCISMWILNNIDKPIDFFLDTIDILATKNSDIIFVLNDVNNGVIPIDQISRKFVDYTGMIGQKIASISNEVYEVKFGLKVRLK
jgi:adenosylcobinamide kinase/adenosylcobinamide-phosphate guanylyltransferase